MVLRKMYETKIQIQNEEKQIGQEQQSIIKLKVENDFSWDN